jgi:hypothetical protein
VLTDLLAGKGSGGAILGVSSPYQWACLTVLCGAGMVLAAQRRSVATGFSVALALFMMPSAFTDLWAFAVGTASQSAVDTAQSLLELVGSGAVIALIVHDVRRDRRPDVADPVGATDSARTSSAAEVALPVPPSAPAERVDA